MKLEDPVCIVHSATGVGTSVARMLAARGGRVVVNYTRSLTETEATTATRHRAVAETLHVWVEVSNGADCRHMASDTLTHWGRIAERTTGLLRAVDKNKGVGGLLRLVDGGMHLAGNMQRRAVNR